MPEIPEPMHTISNLIDAHHEQKEQPPRPHMGVSMIGHACDRYLWLSFRWAVVEQKPGRLLRLFRRGHREEETVIEDLRAIGIVVDNTGQSQSRVHFGSHVSGSADGIVSGLPNAPKRKALLEIKTHSRKSFADLCKNGVEKSHHTHWVQMQAYMLGLGLERALYYAVCKDDDAIYTEWVHFDKQAAKHYVDRAKSIALSETMPPPISDKPTWYVCKMCQFHDFCHVSKMTKQVNCRTCAHSTPTADSKWRCERYAVDSIPVELQRSGCESHVIHPDLVPWELSREHSTEHMATYIVGDVFLQNGDPDNNVYSSSEIVANLQGCLDPFAREVCTMFGAEVTG